MNENNSIFVLDDEQSVQIDSGNTEIPEATITPTITEAAEDLGDPEPTADGSPSSFAYSVDNPLPVVIVEQEVPEEEIEVFALGDTYSGTISDTYLSYFEGIVEKLKPNENYVIWRSGQYSYKMAWGESLELDGAQFEGTSCNVCTLYRDSNNYNSDWYTEFSTDDVSIGTVSLFAYSNLGNYSTVKRGLSYGEEMCFLVAFLVLSVFIILSRFSDSVLKCLRK